MLFQTKKSFFLMLNTKEDILILLVTKQHSDFYYMYIKALFTIFFMFHKNKKIIQVWNDMRVMEYTFL